jgi:hypothetical protein
LNKQPVFRFINNENLSDEKVRRKELRGFTPSPIHPFTPSSLHPLIAGSRDIIGR